MKSKLNNKKAKLKHRNIRENKRDSENEKKLLIHLDHVYKWYKLSNSVKVKALNDYNLKVYEGEFVVIIGPSGSGKTTLVNLIGCLDKPDEGNIYLLGKSIKSLTESNLAQLRGKVMGFVFQQFNLLNTFTALENVALPLVFHDVPASKRNKIAKELLSRFGLGDRIHHKPNQLSGGQQQRVAIARALAVNPKIIIADEPTGNLDSESGNEVMKTLRELHDKEGRTVILVTHDVRYMNVGTRIVKMKDGHVIDDKPNMPEAIKDE